MTLYCASIIESSTETVITALLSDGKFSRVYLCKYTSKKRSSSSAYVAIKVYPRENAKLRSQRIMSEKAVLQRISTSNCPYLNKLISTIKDDSNLYILLEACHCGSLNLHIRSCSTDGFVPRVARNYAAEIISALFSLYKCGCVHRDIKPGNIMVDRYGHLKLCDFGASKILYPEEDFIKIENNAKNNAGSFCPRTYSIIGTMQYMAPEIIAKSCGYSIQVDWWALGVLLFEMLCGVPPAFHGVSSSSSFSDNKNAIEGAMNGTWPDEESSLFALESIQMSSIEQIDSSTSTINSWQPILSESHQSILFATELSILGWNFIQKLLVPCPENRLGPWSMNLIQNDPFFDSINWEDIHTGKNPPPDLFFNKSLGIMDLVEESEDLGPKDSSISEENPFEGF